MIHTILTRSDVDRRISPPFVQRVYHFGGQNAENVSSWIQAEHHGPEAGGAGSSLPAAAIYHPTKRSPFIIARTQPTERSLTLCLCCRRTVQCTHYSQKYVQTCARTSAREHCSGD